MQCDHCEQPYWMTLVHISWQWINLLSSYVASLLPLQSDTSSACLALVASFFSSHQIEHHPLALRLRMFWCFFVFSQWRGGICNEMCRIVRSVWSCHLSWGQVSASHRWFYRHLTIAAAIFKLCLDSLDATITLSLSQPLWSDAWSLMTIYTVVLHLFSSIYLSFAHERVGCSACAHIYAKDMQLLALLTSRPRKQSTRRLVYGDVKPHACMQWIKPHTRA